MGRSAEKEDKEKANRNKTLRENQAHSRYSNCCKGFESEDEEEENDYGAEDINADTAVTTTRMVCCIRALCSNVGRATC